MNNIPAGIIAGLVATAALSALMMLKAQMGVLPGLDVIALLAAIMGTGSATGWVLHFLIGAGYGVLFSRISRSDTFRGAIAKGILLGLVGWVAMMVLLTPVMGKGLFGLAMPSETMLVPLATFMLHVIFGAVLGASHRAITQRIAGTGPKIASWETSNGS